MPAARSFVRFKIGGGSPAATNVLERSVRTLDGHCAAARHAHRALTIDATPHDRLVVAAIDAALHDHRFVVLISAIAAIVGGGMAVASIIRASAPAAITVTTIIGASADLHAEARDAEADLSARRRGSEDYCCGDCRC